MSMRLKRRVQGFEGSVQDYGLEEKILRKQGLRIEVIFYVCSCA